MSRERAGRWLRVSSGGQDEANQEPSIDKWIEEHEYETGPTYRLRGVSASKGKQQKMIDQVIADMKAGRITVLVVWYSARIERRGAFDHFMLAHLVRNAGGRIEYVMEPWLNETNSMSDAFLAMQAGANKQYADTLSKNVGIAFDRIAANGAARGRAPYGYNIVGDKYHKRFVIYEPEAEIIREAVRRYLSGETLDQICADFTAREIPSSIWRGEPGKRWYPKSLARMLRNPTIMGRASINGRTVKCEPIITVADFKAVNARLLSRAHRRGVPASGNIAMLTSVIYCGKCGGPMYRIRPRQMPSYYCRAGKGCKMLIPEGWTNREFNEWFELEYLYSRETITREIPVAAETHDEEIDQLRLDRAELDDTADDYEEKFLAITAQIKELRASVKPARTKTVTLHGRDIANGYHAVSDDERRQFLLDRNFKFYVIKSGDGSPGFSATPPELR